MLKNAGVQSWLQLQILNFSAGPACEKLILILLDAHWKQQTRSLILTCTDEKITAHIEIMDEFGKLSNITSKNAELEKDVKEKFEESRSIASKSCQNNEVRPDYDGRNMMIDSALRRIFPVHRWPNVKAPHA